MTDRVLFTMTQKQYDTLMEAMKPVPYMVIGGYPPPSRQENANAAWARLGEEMGFDYMTVRPAAGGNQLQFTAELKHGEV